MASLRDTVKAVSYTHLDVYKRQFVGRHPAGVCIAVAALLLFIMVSAGLSSCGSMFSGSVSYTHLDVYKRQHMGLIPQQ